jgi:hypothetical protein
MVNVRMAHALETMLMDQRPYANEVRALIFGK